MNNPLQGIRVLDLTNVLAGPFCCHQLAHLGAEVIKVEVPGTGDLARQLGASAQLNEKLMGVSFLAQNTGKKSITLNLKSSEGKEIFRKLISRTDVLVENFRPGVMNRLGLGYEELKERNADLVYCAISGFGQTGPLRHLPAYDQIIQGMSGAMSVTGDCESSPLRTGFPIADTIGGLTAAFAISAALARPKPGRGTMIDISMLESVMATMGWVISNYLVADQLPVPMGNENVTASPSGSFQTASDPINIAANKQEHFEQICEIICRPELVHDPRFANRQARLENRALLKELLEAEFIKRPAGEWQVFFAEAGIPAGEILTVPQALAQPQIMERDLVGTFQSVPGADVDLSYVRTGIRFDGQVPKTKSPPPQLGADTHEVLRSIGLGDEEISNLQKIGVI